VRYDDDKERRKPVIEVCVGCGQVLKGELKQPQWCEKCWPWEGSKNERGSR